MNKKHYPPRGFSDRLEETFLASGLTMTELARRTGIAKSSLYYYMYNNVPPNISTFASLCKALHVSADYLLFGKK